MWVVMMVAMMLPSHVPMLLRYREAVDTTVETRSALLAAVVSFSYFCLWTLVGMVVLPLGFALAQAEMRYPALSRSVPTAFGAIVLGAGVSQFTAWKAHHLACCRQPPPCARGYPRELRRQPADTGVAWRYGMRLGLHCCCSSAGLTAILLVMGGMDLRVMAVVTTLITAERLAPAGQRVGRAIGAILIGAAVVLLAGAAGLR
jgi:predicted metal-binding membrane protein